MTVDDPIDRERSMQPAWRKSRSPVDRPSGSAIWRARRDSNPGPVGSKPTTHEEPIACAIATLCYLLCSIDGLQLRFRNAEQRFYAGAGKSGYT